MSLFAAISRVPHMLSAAHQRGENLVVILAAAQIAGDAVRELLPRGTRVRLEISGRGHHESRHAESALEALLVDDALLHRRELAGGRVGETFDGDDLLAARAMGEERARVMGHIVDKDGAGTALRAVAADLG